MNNSGNICYNYSCCLHGSCNFNKRKYKCCGPPCEPGQVPKYMGVGLNFNYTEDRQNTFQGILSKGKVSCETDFGKYQPAVYSVENNAYNQASLCKMFLLDQRFQ